MKMKSAAVTLLAAVLVLGTALSTAEAGQGRYRYHRYTNPEYPRDDGYHG